MVGELQRRRAGAALAAVDDDEVGEQARLQHCLGDREPLPRVTHAELEAGGLAAGELAQLRDELEHPDRRRERAVAGRRDAVDADLHATCVRDLARDLRAGQHAAVPGLGALAQLDLDHLDLRLGRVFREQLRVERAVRVAAAEVARGHLPDQVAALCAVMHADRAFAGVVREVAAQRAAVQRADRRAAQRAEAHRADVEDAGVVGLGAAGADAHAEVVRGDARGLQRMVDPLVAFGLHVELGAQRALVGVALGALVHQRALLARERGSLVVALDEVLAHLGADELEQEAQVADHGIVAQDRVAALAHVAHAGDHPHQAQQGPEAAGVDDDLRECAEQHHHRAGDPREVADREEAIERQQPAGHGDVS